MVTPESTCLCRLIWYPYTDFSFPFAFLVEDHADVGDEEQGAQEQQQAHGAQEEQQAVQEHGAQEEQQAHGAQEEQQAHSAQGKLASFNYRAVL